MLRGSNGGNVNSLHGLMEAVAIANAVARNGGPIRLPEFASMSPSILGAWRDAHLRAEGCSTADRAINPTRWPAPGERTVLFYDDTGQMVYGALIETFTDDGADGTGMHTFRIRGDDGEVWESPYAALEEDAGPTVAEMGRRMAAHLEREGSR